MLRRTTNRDLRYLLLSAGLCAAVFLVVAKFHSVRSGHGIGLVLGSMACGMMFGAQFLYSWRKRQLRNPRGALYNWLRWHIALGLLGGTFALLHSCGKFSGIAGLAMLLTIVLLLSGFVGRYLFTALDRNAENWLTSEQELQRRLRLHEPKLRELKVAPQLVGELDELANPPRGWKLLLTRLFSPWRQARQIRKRVEKIPGSSLAFQREFSELWLDWYHLRLECESFLVLRSVFAWWYVAHVPLSWITMTLVAVHVLVVWKFWVNPT